MTPTQPASKRAFVIAAVMASMAMVAIEATIVSTAMPQIVAQIGDIHLYSWVFSSFLLGQTAMTVIFGKLADLYGRKPIVLCGIAIFLVGSVLAGFAWTMPAMIVFRLVQGIGAGAIQPVTLTIVASIAIMNIEAMMAAMMNPRDTLLAVAAMSITNQPEPSTP